MFIIRKELKFEAAHVLSGSYSKCCQQVHGHSYRVEVFLKSEKLNEDGMVVDFGKVKEAVGPLIESWDHSFMASEQSHINDFLPAKMIIFPTNPTAENMAQYIFLQVKPFLPQLYKVRVHETATGYAEYFEE